LIVSIGVIAVLIGIVLPSLRGAHEAAKRTACLVNLRELGLAAMLYMNDHDGVLPFAARVYSLPHGQIRPMDALGPYMDAPLPRLDSEGRVVTDAPFLCPADRQFRPVGSIDGMSYAYMPAAFMGVAVPPLSEFAAARGVTRVFESTPSLPLFRDLASWHASRAPDSLASRVGRNHVRYDMVVGHADSK